MKLSTHLSVARKVKAARALLGSARRDLIGEIGARQRPSTRHGRKVPPTLVELLEDASAPLSAFNLEELLLHEHPDIPMVRYAWRARDVGAVTWGAGRLAQMVALDTVAPVDTSTPLLILTAEGENEIVPEPEPELDPETDAEIEIDLDE